MQSIIYEFVDRNGKDYLSISEYKRFQEEIKSDTCLQLVRYIGLEHSEEDREYFKGLSEDELCFALTQYMKNNDSMVFYPN